MLIPRLLALYDKTQEMVDEGVSVPAKNAKPAHKGAAAAPQALPKESPGPADVGQGAPGDSGQAKGREDTNALIASTFRVVSAKKVFGPTDAENKAALRAKLKEKFGAEKTADLTDAQASEFLAYLKTLI
jgi:hypothetical protein